jgi:hypothetical protein
MVEPALMVSAAAEVGAQHLGVDGVDLGAAGAEVEAQAAPVPACHACRDQCQIMQAGPRK